MKAQDKPKKRMIQDFLLNRETGISPNTQAYTPAADVVNKVLSVHPSGLAQSLGVCPAVTLLPVHISAGICAPERKESDNCSACVISVKPETILPGSNTEAGMPNAKLRESLPSPALESCFTAVLRSARPKSSLLV